MNIHRLLQLSIGMVSLIGPTVRAQSDGCDLIAWMKQLPPHSTRTPERPPVNAPVPYLRDTVIDFGNGTTRHISIPLGFTMKIFAHISQCRGLACSSDGVIYATSYNGNI